MKKFAIVSSLLVLIASTVASADFIPGRTRPSASCVAVDGQPYSAQLLKTDGSPVETISFQVSGIAGQSELERFNVVGRYDEALKVTRYIDTTTGGNALELQIRNGGTRQNDSMLRVDSRSGRHLVRMSCQFFMLTM